MKVYLQWLFKIMAYFCFGLLLTDCLGQAENSPESKQNRSALSNGIVLFQERQWDNAIREFSRAIEDQPHRANTYFWRGNAYWAAKDLDKALFDFDKAIHLGNSNWMTYLNRSSVLSQKGEMDRALKDVNMSIQLNSTNAHAYKTRASIYQSQGKFALAIKDWNEGLRLEPADTVALGNRGDCHYEMRSEKDAIADYRISIKVEARNSRAYNSLAWLLATGSNQFRDGQEAVELAKRACELANWKEPVYLDTLAAAFAEAGDFDSAVKYQTKAIHLSNNGETVSRMRKRLDLYRENKPFHLGGEN